MLDNSIKDAAGVFLTGIGAGIGVTAFLDGQAKKATSPYAQYQAAWTRSVSVPESGNSLLDVVSRKLKEEANSLVAPAIAGGFLVAGASAGLNPAPTPDYSSSPLWVDSAVWQTTGLAVAVFSLMALAVTVIERDSNLKYSDAEFAARRKANFSRAERALSPRPEPEWAWQAPKTVVESTVAALQKPIVATMAIVAVAAVAVGILAPTPVFASAPLWIDTALWQTTGLAMAVFSLMAMAVAILEDSVPERVRVGMRLYEPSSSSNHESLAVSSEILAQDIELLTREIEGALRRQEEHEEEPRVGSFSRVVQIRSSGELPSYSAPTYGVVDDRASDVESMSARGYEYTSSSRAPPGVSYLDNLSNSYSPRSIGSGSYLDSLSNSGEYASFPPTAASTTTSYLEQLSRN
jgi:uncharacterized protein (DUF983 family)